MSLDLEDMPAGSKTIVRQTGTCHTLDSKAYMLHSDVNHLLQFMIKRDAQRRLEVTGRVRLALQLTKSATLLQKGKMTFPTGVEEFLEIKTEFPDNPKYFTEPESYRMDQHLEGTILR